MVGTPGPTEDGSSVGASAGVEAARPRLEIAAQDVDGATAAVAHGADRLEICQALAVGGLTPSVALVEHAAARGAPVRPLVRPRAGGFHFSAGEIRAMRRDVEVLAEAGAEGFVLGALTDGGGSDDGELGLDVRTLSTLAEAAGGRPVIVHRCVDVLLGAGTTPEGLVEQLVALGVDGMLTSGGAADAVAGAQTLARLSQVAAGRLEIVAGGGVRPEGIATLAAAGVDAVHLSASGSRSAGPSGPGGGEEAFSATDPQQVRAARAALDAAPETGSGAGPGADPSSAHSRGRS